ncbi:MAG: alpha-ketoacid dehydrogenase subunit beta [Ilumatobacter sp.]|jgi:pyruvate dehydrogenase E1 component beta subunit|uniref:alpha-ketoacid dehydrogenase subunit beta n=1 Tax=Ilumatobacter sp. TaxID=1967498 RepID=UPI00391BDCDD
MSNDLTVLQATTSAMAQAMDVDPSVLVLGEDVGTAGGIFRATQGLQQRFGANRVIDTPLDEKGIAAHAIGMALYGLRPIVEIQFSGFIHDAFEQLMFCGAKYRWITGGEYTCPMVVRAPSFGGIKGGFWHSQSPESYFIHGGGMKVVVPSTPQDAYSLLLAAIVDPDPVLVLEAVPLYRTMSGPVVEDGVPGRIGEAEVVRSGTDVTIVTYGPPRHLAVRAAEEMAASDGYSIEVIDLRSLVPWDRETVSASVRRTGRLVVLHEAAQTLGFGAELAAAVQEHDFGYLHCPVQRVSGHDLPYGFSTGDEYYRPSIERVRAAVRRAMEFEF